MTDNIISLSLAVATILKVLIDLLRITLQSAGIKMVKTFIPLIALFFGPALCILVIVATGATLSSDAIAQALIAGVLAAGQAVGVTELQKIVNERNA